MMKNFKINKENRGLNHSFFKSVKYVSLLFLCISFLWTGCELSRTVPLDDPLYRPQLLIHGMASPRSGAEVGIRYNEPLVEGKARSEEHTSELQSRGHLVCRLLLEK